jgi:hypothetical protein
MQKPLTDHALALGTVTVTTVLFSSSEALIAI